MRRPKIKIPGRLTLLPGRIRLTITARAVSPPFPRTFSSVGCWRSAYSRSARRHYPFQRRKRDKAGSPECFPGNCLSKEDSGRLYRGRGRRLLFRGSRRTILLIARGVLSPTGGDYGDASDPARLYARRSVGSPGSQVVSVLYFRVW
ncbi:hypothetical protein KCP73_17965 [Salmonella enterica subsp. enterica]|nr:hypothetical protein KCP73_17965 [Salmonella enterica subsp. enterica]